MAKNDKAPAVETPAVDFDISQYLPEGWSEKDLVKTGGLPPIYNLDLAFAKKWPAVAGWIHKFEILPIKDDPKPRITIAVSEIVKPTHGTRGPRRSQEFVDVAAGETINVPMTGNLKVNRELLMAIQDVENIYFGVFFVADQKYVNDKGNAMWVFDCRIAFDKKKPRSGRYMLTPAYVHAIARGDLALLAKGELPQTRDGSSFDPVTGEVYEQGRALPVGATA